MKHLLQLLFLTIVCSILQFEIRAQSNDFVITTTATVPDGEVKEAVYFFEDYALVTVANEAEAIFNLDSLWWRGLAGPDEGVTITLEQAEEWAAASLAMSDSTLLETVDEQVATFVRALVYPELKLTEKGDTLIFENAAFRYTISETTPITPIQTQRFYKYDRLNAFRKAMIYRKLPPFAQLEVAEALAARQVLPTTLTFTLRHPQGETEMVMRVQVKKLEAGEADKFRALLPE